MSALRVADGWITAADFAGRRSRALFVLSACRTGDPSLLHRGETLGGFPRSLLIAGCRGVVASRWEVRDPVARAWMGYFYDALRREPPDAAVAEAARLVRERFPHPADWAAFLYLRGSTT
jgi:CHAT domain-containing protein